MILLCQKMTLKMKKRRKNKQSLFVEKNHSLHINFKREKNKRSCYFRISYIQYFKMQKNMELIHHNELLSYLNI